MAYGPGFSGRQVLGREGIVTNYLGGLGGLGISGWIDQGDSASAGLAGVRIAGGGFAVQRQAQDFADRLVRILGRREALAVSDREEQILAVGANATAPPSWPPLPLGI